MSIEGRTAQLRRTHRELETKIAEEELRPASDTLRIADMKRRKLAIREELRGVEKIGD